MNPGKFLQSDSFLLLLVFILSTIIVGCRDNEYSDILTSGGSVASPEQLSAGNSTIFTSTSKAYDTPANWVTGELMERFLKGDLLYDNPRVSGSDPTNGGLGPVYAGYSCGSCHSDAGRTKPSLFSSGGSGPYGFSSFLTFIRSTHGQNLRQYGRVLHDQAIYGKQPEGKLRVTYTETEYSFADGEKYRLAKPHYQIYDWYADSISSDQLVMSVRTPLRHVGLGLIMAVDQDEIKQLATIQYPSYGISGKINWVTERNVKVMGLTGHKAQHGDLTVELGFSSDLGVTNDRYPHEVSEGQSQSDGDSDIQVTTEEMADVDFYLHALGVPARRAVNNTVVQQGKELFNTAKCNLCHTPTLHTRQGGVQLIDGSRLPWLGKQVFHPYSDFLLHDMGPELGDDYSQFEATGDEWRSTPLWGIGLQEIVNGHTYFLHDGRARNYVEAIMWHGGEGEVSRQIFKKMAKEDREALIMFLRSL